MLSNILDRISFWALFAVIVLLPIFFLPFAKVSPEISKGLLLVVGLSVSIIFWIAARFSDGKIVIPKSWLLVSLAGIVVTFFLSALFSPVMKVSFFGTMLDTDSFYFMLGASLLMLFSAIILRDKKDVKLVFTGVMLSSFLVLLFQAVRLFAPEFFSLGILGGKIDNLVGSWNAFGIFAGFSAVASLFALEFLSLSKIIKIFFSVFIVLSILFVALVNFHTIWILLGVFALIVFVYKVSFAGARQELESGEKASFPTVSFVVVMISLLFIMAGQFIGGFLSNRLQVSNLDIRPSFSATLSLTQSVIKEDPIFGVGPNRFAEAWALYKPAVINSTLFWNSSFDFGMSTMLTAIVTNGILGILVLLSFIVLLVGTFFKSLFVLHKRNDISVDTVMFSFLAFYLFVSLFVYSTGPTIFLLAFAFLGIYIAISKNTKADNLVFTFFDNHRKSFFSILLLVIFMLFIAGITFKYIQRFASVIYLQKTFTAQDMKQAESYVNKALSLYTNDLYFRTYAEVYLLKLNSITSKESLSEEDKVELKDAFDKVISSAQNAVAYDRTNYINFRMLGSVYQSVAPLGVEGAYEQAIESFKIASSLNPLNPGLKLDIANTFVANKNIKEAKDYVKQALSLKPDYIEGLLAYSQILKMEGSYKDAVSYAEMALSLAPQNKNLIDYLASLKNTPASAPESENESEN